MREPLKKIDPYIRRKLHPHNGLFNSEHHLASEPQNYHLVTVFPSFMQGIIKRWTWKGADNKTIIVFGFQHNEHIMSPLRIVVIENKRRHQDKSRILTEMKKQGMGGVCEMIKTWVMVHEICGRTRG